MIDQLANHITEEQINGILDIIINQYRMYRHLIDSPQFNNIFLDEYAPHNRQFGVSWAISSAFPSDNVICDNINVTRLVYGKQHTRPQLYNDRVILHILNQTTHFNAKYLEDFYQKNSNNFNNEQLYCFLRFKVESRTLKEVSICLPNPNGTVFAEEILLSRDIIMHRIA